MKEIKNYDLVTITKLNENINLIDKKITFQSSNVWKDIQKVIIKEGYGVYKVEYKKEVEWWFNVNYNTMYAFDRDMKKEEIKGFMDYLNKTYK